MLSRLCVVRQASAVHSLRAAEGAFAEPTCPTCSGRARGLKGFSQWLPWLHGTCFADSANFASARSCCPGRARRSLFLKLHSGAASQSPLSSRSPGEPPTRSYPPLHRLDSCVLLQSLTWSPVSQVDVLDGVVDVLQAIRRAYPASASSALTTHRRSPSLPTASHLPAPPRMCPLRTLSPRPEQLMTMRVPLLSVGTSLAR